MNLMLKCPQHLFSISSMSAACTISNFSNSIKTKQPPTFTHIIFFSSSSNGPFFTFFHSNYYTLTAWMQTLSTMRITPIRKNNVDAAQRNWMSTNKIKKKYNINHRTKLRNNMHPNEEAIVEHIKINRQILIHTHVHCTHSNHSDWIDK